MNERDRLVSAINGGVSLFAIIRVGTPWMNFLSDERLEVYNGY